jgi:hypothetical protein
MQRFLKMVSWEKFEGGEKRKDFSKMVSFYGQPAQVEDEKCFERGLVIMGDLPGREVNCLKG